jgi:hypothetical protein
LVAEFRPVESFYEEIDERYNPIFFSGQPCERRRPDWARGHQRIDYICNDLILNNKIDPDFIRRTFHLGDHPKIQETLHKYLEQIELCYRTGYALGFRYGYLVCLEFFPYRVWATGGESDGDAPTDLYYPVEAMNGLSVLDAVGFNPVLPNYRKMIHTIIKSKELQPLLLHTDPDLDKLLEKEFKNDTDIHEKQVPGNPPRPSRKHKKVGKTSP